MTVITIPDTGEVITHADVRDSIEIAKAHGEKFFEQIVWQVENETWHILGYDSWDEMREAEYGDLGVVAPRADRPELVSRLRKHLTQKETADTLGVSKRTVAAQSANLHFEDEGTTITNSRGQKRPANYKRRASTPGPEPEPDDDIETVDAEIVNENETEDTMTKTKPKKAEATNKTINRQVALINDIRLYLGHMGESKEIANLPNSGKQHVINALQDAIDAIERTMK